MKKQFLILAIITLIFSHYNSVFGKEKLGFRGGYQYSMTAKNGYCVGDPMSTFYFGAYKIHTLGLKEIFTLNGGLEYMQGGWLNDENNYRRIHYASIPLFARLKLGPLFGQAGFNLNFNLKDDYKLLGVDALTSSNKYPFMDVPFQIGVGVKYMILTLEVRYHYGLTEVADATNNRYIQFGAGIHF